MSQPIHHLVDVNDIQLSCYEWNPAQKGSTDTLIFVHATGFHGRCWDQVIKHFPEHHVISVDQRAHGLSSNESFNNWREFAEDLSAALAALEIRGGFAVGHSMGAHTATMAASLTPELFRGLMLIDPVIMEQGMYGLWDDSVLAGDPRHPASKRRNAFTSLDDALDRYRDRAPYNIFDSQAFEDYFRHGLHDAEEGLELACPPHLEARIYDTALSNQGIHAAVEKVDVPVTVVRAMQAPSMEDLIKDFRYSPTWPELAGKFVNGKDVLIEELTHFMPMQAPERVADLIRDCLSDKRLAPC